MDGSSFRHRLQLRQRRSQHSRCQFQHAHTAVAAFADGGSSTRSQHSGHGRSTGSASTTRSNAARPPATTVGRGIAALAAMPWTPSQRSRRAPLVENSSRSLATPGQRWLWRAAASGLGRKRPAGSRERMRRMRERKYVRGELSGRVGSIPPDKEGMKRSGGPVRDTWRARRWTDPA